MWDARPDSNDLPGHDIRPGSKIGIDVHGEEAVVFYVDCSNAVDSLKYAKIPVPERAKRQKAPITVVTDVELREPEEKEDEAGGGSEDRT